MQTFGVAHVAQYGTAVLMKESCNKPLDLAESDQESDLMVHFGQSLGKV